MRRGGLVLVALALVLAGCSSRPPLSSNSTFSDPTPLSARAHTAHLVERTLTVAAVTLSPGPETVNVPVPEQVVASAFYLTFDGGVSAFPHADLDGCALTLNGTIAASGQTYGKDCGALSAGTQIMRLSQTSGSAQLRVTVNATVRVCEPTNTSSSCEPEYGDRTIGHGP